MYAILFIQFFLKKACGTYTDRSKAG
jgi:hypothetical protein